jgi:hypothetical protein
MSPFGKKKDDDQQGPGDTNPQLDAEVTRLQGLTPAQRASEIMSKAFSTQYDPTEHGHDVPGIADEFFPRPDWSLGDSTVKAKVRQAQAESQPSTPQHQLLVLADLVAEGVQALEHASLIRLKTNYDQGYFHAGYVATALGREALEQNAVDKILAGGSL